jgi:hypothetical protein
LPPGSQTFAALSVLDARHSHGVFVAQSESTKHSSYEQPPELMSGSLGKQRPFFPAVQSESDEQPFDCFSGYGCVGGPEPRALGHVTAVAR